MAALAAEVADEAPGATPSNDLYERTARRQRIARRVEKLDQDSWRSISADGDLETAFTTMSEAAVLARSEFGDDHWLAVWKNSLALGMKSLGELPYDRKELFVEASKDQARAVFLWSQGTRDRALVQLRKAQGKRTQALGDDHIISVNFLLGLALLECEVEDYRDAKRHAEGAIRGLETIWGK